MSPESDEDLCDSDICDEEGNIGTVNLNHFAYWDCPAMRTRFRPKTQQRIYIPVYEISKYKRKLNHVNIAVDVRGEKRKVAKLKDLIYLHELEPNQTVQYWKKNDTIGDYFPNVGDVSDSGSQWIPIVCENQVIDGLNLSLTTTPDHGSSVPFWNTALPESAQIQRKTKLDLSKSIHKPIEELKVKLPNDILAIKRGSRLRDTGTNVQQILLSIEDDDEDEDKDKEEEEEEILGSSRRKTMRLVDDDEVKSTNAPSQSKDFEDSAVQKQVLEELRRCQPVSNLFSDFTFNVLPGSGADKVSGLISQSGGTVQNEFDENMFVNFREGNSNQLILLMDKIERRMIYYRCITGKHHLTMSQSSQIFIFSHRRNPGSLQQLGC